MNIVKFRAAFTLTGMSLLAAFVVTGALAKPPKAAAGNAVAGKKVYDASTSGCAACHAINGKGGTGGPELTTVGADAAHTAAWFKVQVTNPKAHKADGTMPSYADKIKGKDLDNLAAYLVSLKKAAAPK